MLIPSTQNLADQHLASLEASVAQSSPLNNKAFLRVLSVLLALAHTGLYKLAAERALQNLALTATGPDLDLIGAEVNVYRKAAEHATLTVTLLATTGATIPTTSAFIGDANGQRYTPNSAAVSILGSATLTLTADVAGVIGNLQDADTLTMVSPLPGAGTTAIVTATTNVGAEEETDDEYRTRILFELRSTKGGGNATDYKTWAEAVAGVVRAFPYAGKPVSSLDPSYPGDRTVYVEADTTIDPDGVPGGGLLAEVRAALNIDPTTGKSRPGLGLVDSTLYVEAIRRTAVNITITNLAAPPGTEADVRAQISAALTAYFLTFAPYVDGVDLVQDRNDRITDPSVAAALKEVFDGTGSSAASIEFAVDGVPYTSYQLAADELAKLGGIVYAVV